GGRSPPPRPVRLDVLREGGEVRARRGFRDASAQGSDDHDQRNDAHSHSFSFPPARHCTGAASSVIEQRVAPLTASSSIAIRFGSVTWSAVHLICEARASAPVQSKRTCSNGPGGSWPEPAAKSVWRVCATPSR